MKQCFERVIKRRIPRPRGESVYEEGIEFFITESSVFVKEMNYKRKKKFILNENPPITIDLYELEKIYFRRIHTK